MKVYDEYLNHENTETIEKLLKNYDKTLMQLKNMYPDFYEDTIQNIYVCLYGYHFNENSLKEALACMINDDDTPAPKWSISDTNSFANSNGIKFEHFNEYD